MQNHYFDASHPLHPYTHTLPAMPDTLAPDDALRKKLPKSKDGFHFGEKGGSWVYIEDHRGKEGYVDGKPFTIADFGPYPNGWSDAQPVPVPTLEEAKADAVQKIKDAGYAAEVKGITLQGMTILTDRESQSMITGAVVGTLLDPTKTTRWQTATTQDGMPVFIELPAPQLQAIGQAMRNHVQRCFDVRDAKFAAVAALKTPKAVADWLTANLAADWPE